MTKRGGFPVCFFAVLLTGVWLLPAVSQQAPKQASPKSPPATSGEKPAAPATSPGNPALDEQRTELRGLQDTLSASDTQRRKIEAEIESLRNDRARLNAALISTTAHINTAESQISAAEDRLNALTGSEAAARHSLESRKAVIAQVLASLQRMGLNPPPALLVDPEDMLRAVRSSILLGAVLPKMRAEADALAADLSELVRLHKSIASQRDSLRHQIADLDVEQKKLSALIAARQASLGTAKQALAAERKRAGDIARHATSLRQLIAQTEKEVAAAARAAEAARQADAARKLAKAENGGQTKNSASPFKNMARLAPAIAFADAKHLLSMPVAGTVLKGYGASDGFGGTEKGLFIATRPGAVVSMPSDGWIAYSGPYRSYGQLLIVNTGGGYYIILAGMERINVEVGQFVLAGEPVATMGDGSAKTAAAIAIGSTQPILYVEFRKDGAAIDPSPWWAKADVQKVGG